MSRLHDSASLGALILALGTASYAQADTTIKKETTSALETSEAGDITMTSAGSIVLSSGNAITVDSDNDLDIDGDIDMSNATKADGATAIYVNSGTTSDIYIDEDADITIEEDYVVDDDNDDYIVTTGIAEASNRYGIYVAGDASGSITNYGDIYVEGQDSGGIVLAGDYTGDILNDGTIKVIGDNAVGISTQGVDGDITIMGSVYVVGDNATAVSINGDVTGTVTLQGTISQLYYYTDDDGNTEYLSRAALREGAAAVEITGNVDGGIVVKAAPDDDDNDDADGDGVDDDEEESGAIVSYGNGPAIQVGGTDDITIGSSDSYIGTYSIAIEGSVTGNSYYSNTDAYGLVIGGQGGNVTLTDGIGVSGTLEAITYDSAATALLINEGSSVTSLYNSGTIIASVSSGGEATLVAIQDLSGTLTSITNTGFITASGTSTDTTVALDLSANTTGVTITQYLNDDDAETSADYLEDNDVDVDPTVYTAIYGDILLGSGDDTIDASSGEIEGDTSFGAGDDTLILSGDTNYIGDIDWGTGTATATMSDTSTFDGTMNFEGETGTLTINDSAVYTGDFENADNLTVTVNGGDLIADTDGGGAVSFGTLYVGSDGVIGVNVDGDDVSYFNVTNATLADGASVTATITDLTTAEGTYTVLTSDNLTIEGDLNVADDLPFIYSGEVTTDTNDVYLTVSRKSTSDLGLTSSSASAWDAIYAASANDDYMTESLLQVDDSETLNEQTASMLPDHAGGIFEAVTTGTRLVSQHIADDTSTFGISDVGGWFEPIYWQSSKATSGTASYKISGWGLSLGLERKTKLGYFGFSYAYLSSTVKDNGGSQDLDVGQHDFGVFWRKKSGALLTYARLGASKVSIGSTRNYTGTIDDTDFSYEADADWNGWLLSGMAGASYRYQVSRRFSLRPRVDLEQFWLHESGYSEDSSDSDAIPLTVASRTSKSTTVTPMLAAAYSLGQLSPDWRPLTFQLEAGRREVLSGGLGKTTAYFNGGDTYDAGESFTIDPDSIKGAWISELSLYAGGYDFTWKITTRVERTNDSTDFSARAGLSVAF
ncbi:autotransporter outer membrane beta-barrel domain-containing protein [Novosphingobium sp. 1949]|uniref:Autotransporter outer membrane beta-barrel domain-containing protein n=1 Tax=Novosphingobium organovorum TaxID=2930092 RepID=A0ABT0BFE9_9SPHN|nr:autotransporter outer membrane beta-barrel domain-containing protein [Novosphingobium organovorum]MCJ2183761.1 autotransporter outer membrane beta-barrel domain-containing protein [Novosphingobium organovorum]